MWLVLAVLGLGGVWCWVGPFGHQNLGFWGTISSLRWRDLTKPRTMVNMFVDFFDTVPSICATNYIIQSDFFRKEKHL